MRRICRVKKKNGSARARDRRDRVRERSLLSADKHGHCSFPNIAGRTLESRPATARTREPANASCVGGRRRGGARLTRAKLCVSMPPRLYREMLLLNLFYLTRAAPDVAGVFLSFHQNTKSFRDTARDDGRAAVPFVYVRTFFLVISSSSFSCRCRAARQRSPHQQTRYLDGYSRYDGVFGGG